MIEYREIAEDYRVGTDGFVWSKKSGTWVRLKGTHTKDGYLEVAIAGKKHLVHLLILEAFVGPRPEGMWGLHKNDVKKDNRLENLYWGTPLQNSKDAADNGKVQRKLDPEKARKIVKLRDRGVTHKKIARRFAVATTTVEKVLCGKLWSEATGIKPRKRDDFEGPRRASSIQLLASWDWTPMEIVDFLEVTPAQVDDVLSGKSWGRVTGITKKPPLRQHIDAVVPEIRRLRRKGWTLKRVGQLLGVSETTVANVAKGRRRRRPSA